MKWFEKGTIDVLLSDLHLKKGGTQRTNHSKQHSVSSFEIKRVLVYNSTILYFTDLFILYIFIQNAYADKKYERKKANKLCLMGQIMIYSHSFLEY